MKRFLIGLTLFCVAISTAVAVEKMTPWTPGVEWITQVQAAFKQGQYNNFLRVEDQWYQAGLKKGQWQPLIEDDQKLLEQYNAPGGKKIFAEITVKVDQFEDELRQLKHDRDTALAKVADKYPQAKISTMIQARLKQPQPTTAQFDAVKKLDEWLSPFPLHADTPGLRQLKAVEMEYQVKNLLLQAAYAQGDEKNPKVPDFGKLNPEILAEYQIALGFEKMDKMLAIANKAKEQDLIQTIGLAIDAFLLSIAEIHDGQAIEEESQSLDSEANDQVADILHSFNTQKAAIVKKYGVGK